MVVVTVTVDSIVRPEARSSQTRRRSLYWLLFRFSRATSANAVLSHPSRRPNPGTDRQAKMIGVIQAGRATPWPLHQQRLPAKP